MAEKGEAGFLEGVFNALAEFFQGVLTGKVKSKFLTNWFSIDGWVTYVGDWGISRGLFLSILFFTLWAVAYEMTPLSLELAGSWILLLLPILLPIAAWIGLWNAWLWYAQANYIYARTKPVLLEVKMPAEVMKSPRAMEQVLTSFWNKSGTTTFYDRYWYGGSIPFQSLEICSFGGEIHFFIWCRGVYRNILEAAMYSQYPEVEIVEAEDYASKFQYDPKQHWMWGTDYTYERKKGSDLYPIKTYVDFELDQDRKEEYIVDPYGSVLEVLSALNKNEQVWIQIVMQGYFGKALSKGSYQYEVAKEVDRIRDAASKGIMYGFEAEAEEKKDIGFPRPTYAQTEQMRSMERNASKLIFEVGMRGVYIAPPGKQRSPEFAAYRNIWRPFANSTYQNNLKASGGHNIFDFLWQDWNSVRWNLIARRYVDAYRRRMFFHAPWHMYKEPMRMSVEVLATLWHPPSSAVKTPGLQRIPVSKSEAPPNLPM